MIRQLRRLMRPVQMGDANATALCVYRERRNGRWVCVPARDMGYEGVACLDDVARAAWLFLDAWERYRVPGALTDAARMLVFVRQMQQPDGRFVNFVNDWRGRKNLTGPTSYPGGAPWHARAVLALSRSAVVLGSQEDLARANAAWPYLQAPTHLTWARTLHILAALELERATGEDRWVEDACRWAEELMAHRDAHGCFLKGDPGAPFRPWGYIHPGAIALLSARTSNLALMDAAVRSTRSIIEPIVRGGFALAEACPYDVSSAVFNLQALYRVTSDRLYQDLLHLARAWFRGRNPLGQAVYDPYRGFCHDGIADGGLNPNSGAESNIEGAFALMDELPWPLLCGAQAVGAGIHTPDLIPEARWVARYGPGESATRPAGEASPPARPGPPT